MAGAADALPSVESSTAGPRIDGGAPHPPDASVGPKDSALPGPDDAGFAEDCAALAPGPSCVHPPVTAQCDGGWCFIPKGCFVMGSPPCEWGRGRYNETESATTLTHDFLVKQTEVTQGEWTALGLPHRSRATDAGYGDCVGSTCPVGGVGWFEATAFANLLSEAQGLPKCFDLAGCSGSPGVGMTCASTTARNASIYDCAGYRLPTSAEWEYVARAGTRTAVFSGDLSPLPNITDCADDPVLNPVAWFCFNSGGLTHPVAGKKANGWGVFDIAGNAVESTLDTYAPVAHGPAARINPGSTLAPGPDISVRGGAAHIWASLARSAAQLPGTRGVGGPTVGFRLVRRAD
ncbi:MAG: SUMF1/EgtB/PvdO family nonheme iron enzyme [Myxococcales bacterium]|nr:SUMF1/EgtB/PvdO family nonheme iron enzyme [Myxococcales bacterium]